MSALAYSLDDYVEDLRQITRSETDEKAIVRRVEPLARKLMAKADWVTKTHKTCNPDQGFGVHLLHEEPDHSNAVFLLAWMPDRGTLPHNHKTWAVVVGVEGDEEEVIWHRRDDGARKGHAELERGTNAMLAKGKSSCLLSEDIHSVWNTGREISMSLHTYGRHINHTDRSEFDPEANAERPFIVTVQEYAARARSALFPERALGHKARNRVLGGAPSSCNLPKT